MQLGHSNVKDGGRLHIVDDKQGEEKIVKTLEATIRQKTLRRQARTGFAF